MQLAIAFILHLILSISTNGSDVPRRNSELFSYEQELLLAQDRELQEIRFRYGELMILKDNFIHVPHAIIDTNYLEGMRRENYLIRSAINKYLRNHRAQRHSEKVRIAIDMKLELEILNEMILKHLAEMRHAEELPQQHQDGPSQRTSSQQEPVHPSDSTEPPDVIHVMMPGSDRTTHFGYHIPAPGSQQRDQGSSSNAGHGSQ